MSSHTNSPPVIVVMNSDDCVHCRNLRNIWHKIEEKIESDNLNVRIVQLEFHSMTSPIPSEYPSDLKRFTSWFPMILVVPGADWDQAMQDTSNYKFSNVEVFNSKYVDERLSYDKQYDLNDPESFSQWVKSVLSDSRV